MDSIVEKNRDLKIVLEAMQRTCGFGIVSLGEKDHPMISMSCIGLIF